MPSLENVPVAEEESLRKPGPSLKIKLKFSGVGNSDRTPTPSDEVPSQSGQKSNSRSKQAISNNGLKRSILIIVSQGAPGSEYDSEDSLSRLPSNVPPVRMTQRQAARAGMLDSTDLLVLGEY